MVWREGYKKIFAGGGGGVIFNMGVKRKTSQERGREVEKKLEGKGLLLTLKETMVWIV